MGVVWAARFEEEQIFLPPPDIETQFHGLLPRSLVAMWNNLSQLGSSYPRSSENELQQESSYQEKNIFRRNSMPCRYVALKVELFFEILIGNLICSQQNTL
jgi:hypothetical protein